MRRGGCWTVLVDKAQKLWRPSVRGRRVRLTWQTCKRCGSYSFVPTGSGPLCGSCRSLQ
jgi:uncharacterized OB-fold protein